MTCIDDYAPEGHTTILAKTFTLALKLVRCRLQAVVHMERDDLPWPLWAQATNKAVESAPPLSATASGNTGSNACMACSSDWVIEKRS